MYTSGTPDALVYSQWTSSHCDEGTRSNVNEKTHDAQLEAQGLKTWRFVMDVNKE